MGEEGNRRMADLVETPCASRPMAFEEAGPYLMLMVRTLSNVLKERRR